LEHRIDLAREYRDADLRHRDSWRVRNHQHTELVDRPAQRQTHVRTIPAAMGLRASDDDEKRCGNDRLCHDGWGNECPARTALT
jgi:hypothetical protein